MYNSVFSVTVSSLTWPQTHLALSALLDYYIEKDEI